MGFEDDDGPYTIPQGKALAVLALVSGLLSILGSSCILYILLTSNGREKTYDRLLLGLSTCDLLTSPFVALAFFMAPREAGFVWARGNEVSCSMAGFAAQCSLACACYNASLSFYYLMRIRLETPERIISRFYEPLMHLGSTLFPMTTAILGAASGMFNPFSSGLGCWFAEYPPGCSGSSCERGSSAWLYAWIMAGTPVVLMFVAVAINYTLIFLKVRNQQRRNVRHSFQGEELQIEQSKRRQRATAVQAALYTFSFFNTFFWVFLHESVHTVFGVNIFALSIMWSTFYPLQGFFNFFIYIRPRYLQWRKNYPESSRLWAIRQCVLAANKSPRTPSTASASIESYGSAKAIDQSIGSRSLDNTGDNCEEEEKFEINA